MKNDPESDRLLDDVLAELAPPDFRAGLLDRTLKQVRRKQRFRQLNRGLLATACVAAFGLLVLHNRAPVARKSGPSPEMSLTISSQPLDASAMIVSVPDSIPIFSSDIPTIPVISTDAANRNYRELTDDELLALMPGQPAVLVRQGPHQAELLLVDSNVRVISPGERLDR